MSVNKVILLGNIGRDPELRYFENNKVVAQFSLATSETFTDKQGNKRTDTEWHIVEMWDSLAKTAEKYLKKGMQVYIEGKIRTYKWKDKEGHEISDKKIRATSMTLLNNAQRKNDVEDIKDHSSENPSIPESAGNNLTNELPF
jgi:single-strand DNA-binding protein